jgi:hypothetical protein
MIVSQTAKKRAQLTRVHSWGRISLARKKREWLPFEVNDFGKQLLLLGRLDRTNLAYMSEFKFHNGRVIKIAIDVSEPSETKCSDPADALRILIGRRLVAAGVPIEILSEMRQEGVIS